MFERIRAIIEKLDSGDDRFYNQIWVGKDYSKKELLADLNALLMPPQTMWDLAEDFRDDPQKALDLLVQVGILNPDGTLKTTNGGTNER